MRAQTYVCEYPDHDGERAQIHYTDRYEERVEIRRLSDYGRERVIKVIDICKACSRKKYPRRPEGNGTISMFPAKAGDPR